MVHRCQAPAHASFQGKTVLLTGASGGLGKALALELARCQVHQIVLSGRNEPELHKVARECEEVYPLIKTHILTCDLSVCDDVARLAEQALSLCDAIDVLINNGGVSSRSKFVDTKLEVDERVMQINFFAGASLAKALVPSMQLNQYGKIIWISSVQGLVGIPARSSYAASKFAVQGYCESLGAELASSGITVHVVSPGYMRTNLSKSALTGDGRIHGKLDATTASGELPHKVAVSILNATANGQTDIIVAATASARAAILLRFLCPSLLRRILIRRFEKAEQATKKKD